MSKPGALKSQRIHTEELSHPGQARASARKKQNGTKQHDLSPADKRASQAEAAQIRARAAESRRPVTVSSAHAPSEDPFEGLRSAVYGWSGESTSLSALLRKHR